MFKFLNLQPEVFGVDVNDLFLRIVKLKKKRGRFKLVSFNEVDIKPGIVKEGVIQDQEALVNIIRSAFKTVKGEKLDTKYVIISLPEEKSFSQVIKMPKMTNEELSLAVPIESENYIPLPIDKVYLDFEVIEPFHKSDASHSHLLINVMPKHIIDSYVVTFKKAGLIPCVLEVESQAIIRALVKIKEKAPSLVFIDLGHTNTTFIVFSGNSIRFTCSIPISSQQLTQAISDYLSISFDDAEELKIKYGLSLEIVKKYNIRKAINSILDDLANQIKKYINFYHNNAYHEYILTDRKIEKVILCGGGANLRGLTDFLFAQLKIPVELGNPLINISLEKRGIIIPQRKLMSFTTVLGLALRGVNDINI